MRDRDYRLERPEGFGPRHDPTGPRPRPSISEIRHRTGLMLLALLTAITLAIGYGMTRFVMWLGGLMAEQLIPHPIEGAHPVAATIAVILAALI